jgi:hypothetical protein
VADSNDDLKNLEQRLDARLIRMESSIETLTGNVSSIAASVKGIGDAVSSQQNQISAIRDRGNTNWGQVFAGVSLVVTLGVLALTPLYAANSRVEATLTDHIKLDGHPTAMAKHEKYEPMFDSLWEADQQSIADRKRLLDLIHDIDTRVTAREANAFTSKDAQKLLERISRIEAGAGVSQ